MLTDPQLRLLFDLVLSSSMSISLALASDGH